MYFKNLIARFLEKISIKSAYLDKTEVRVLLVFKKVI